MFSKYKRNAIRDQNSCKIAAALIADKNLVWSDDFERIRLDLVELLNREAVNVQPDRAIVQLANTLLEDEYDLTAVILE
jgi:hypothetical protein